MPNKTKNQLAAELKKTKAELADLQSRISKERTSLHPVSMDEHATYISKNIPFAYHIMDAGANIMEINTAWTKLLGFAADEIHGRYLGDFVHQNSAKKFIELFEQQGFDNEANIQLNFWHKENKEVSVALKCFKEFDHTGKYLRTHCILNKIAEQDCKDAALDESKKRFYNLLQNVTNVAVQGYLLDGTTTYWNKAAEALYGYKAKEAIGRNLIDLIIPDEMRKEVKKAIAWMAQTGKPIPSEELRLKHKNGSYVDVFSSHTILNLPGSPPELYCIDIDLTNRLQAESKLKQFTERNKALLEANPDMMFLLNPENRIIDYHASNRDALYIEPEVFLGKKAEEVLPAEVAELFVNKVHQVLQTQQPTQAAYELPIMGETRLFESRFVPCGKNEVLSIVRDITEKVAAEKALKESENRFRKILDNMPVLLNAFDENGHFIVWNKACETSTGYLAEEIIGNPDAMKWLYPEPEYRQQIWENSSKKNAEENIFDLVAKNGEKRSIAWFDTYLKLPLPGWASWGLGIDVTEQIRAKKDLISSQQNYKLLQELFRNMADIMPDMVWAKDLNKNYIFANRSICENLLNAKDTNEPIGKNDMYFAQRERHSHPGDASWHTFGEICSDSDSIVLKSGETGQFDEFGNVKGKFLYLDVVKTPLRDESGEIIGVVGTARDVTKNKQAEKQLKDSEAKLSLAMKVANMGYWQFDLETNKVDWSDDHNQLFGITDHSFGGTLEAVLSYVHPEDRTNSEKNFKKAIEQGKPYSYRYRVVHPDGTVRWLYSYGEFIKDENSKLTSIFGITQDISKQKEIEESLLFETRFRQLLMDISARFINIPLNRVDEAVNESLVMMGLFVQADRSYTFDYDWENDVCHNTYEWCRDGISAEIDNLQNVPLAMMRAWVVAHRQGKPMYVPDVFALPKGQERDILEPQGVKSVLTVPKMDQDKCIGFVGFDSVNNHHVYSDTEQQLLKIYAQLLTNIKLRIHTEKELIAAKEKAEASDKLKTAFMQNISHEIRTPLNHIIGFSEILILEETSQDERNNVFEHIQKGSNRLLDTITDYMDISLLVTGNMIVNPKTTSIAKLLEKLLHQFSPHCLDKGLSIELIKNEQSPDVNLKTDPELLLKLLSQLIDNAIKFTFNGGVDFGYQIRESYVEFFVNDTGKGIASDKLEIIFEPFKQAETFNTRGYEGSGLGLSIAMGIGQLLGGKIRAESVYGKGSTFYFSLSLIPTESLRASAKQTAKPLSPVTNPLILIAEDDETNLKYLKLILKKAGFDTVGAINGEEAIEKIRTTPAIKLVLMDIKMPVMDGLEATRQIKQLYPHIPVIALTAYAQAGDEHKVLQAGCDDYLAKPVGREALLSYVKRYVSKL